MTMITIEDRLAIEELYARHWWALDRGDAAAFAATFTEDGLLAMHEDHRGRTAIADFVRAVAAAPAGGQTNHHMSSLVLTAAGEDVTGQSYVLRVHRLPTRSRGNTQILWSGYSIDRCVRGPDGWRFAERALRAWEGDVPAPSASAVEGLAA